MHDAWMQAVSMFAACFHRQAGSPAGGRRSSGLHIPIVTTDKTACRHEVNMAPYVELTTCHSRQDGKLLMCAPRAGRHAEIRTLPG